GRPCQRPLGGMALVACEQARNPSIHRTRRTRGRGVGQRGEEGPSAIQRLNSRAALWTATSVGCGAVTLLQRSHATTAWATFCVYLRGTVMPKLRVGGP